MPKPYEPNPVVTQNLSALMKARGVVSQPALAMKSGVQQTTVGRILRGATSPMADTLKLIADALGCDMGLLYLPPTQFQELLESGRSMRFDISSLGGGARRGVLQVVHSASISDDSFSLQGIVQPFDEIAVDLGVPAYGVKIRGDGGSPVLKAGQVLALQDDGQLQPGDLAVFKFTNGASVLKEFLFEQPGIYATASLVGNNRATLDKSEVGKISLVVGVLPASRVQVRREL